MRRWLPGILAALLLGTGCGLGQAGAPALVVGAIYPVSGAQAEGGREELGGLRAALRLAQEQGLPGGRPVALKLVPVETPEAARRAVDRLVDQDHVAIIAGTYGSTLAEAAAARADDRHTIYWETGAVADLVSQDRGYVFRTVAMGSSLGRTAVQFTADRLLRAEDRAAARAVIVNVDDVYGRSVADGEQQLAAQLGVPVVDRIQYEVAHLDPDMVAARLSADRADYLWDVSYVDDGVAIVRAIQAARVPLRAAIGTSSAFCMPEFGRRLGPAAIGLYAADKPDDRVSAAVLTPAARALLARARRAYGGEMPIPAVAGFVGGWALFHSTLPRVRGTVTPDRVRAAAYAVDDAPGTSINGGGVRFAAPDSSIAGQNLRAPSVVGQWQAVEVMRTVYPAGFASA